MNRLLIGTLLVVGCSAAIGQSRSPPTDLDLNAAYCLRVIQGTYVELGLDGPNMPVQGFSKADQEKTDRITNEMRADQNSKMDRLKRYLVVRSSAIDAGPMLIAAAQADSDLAFFHTHQDQMQRECPGTVGEVCSHVEVRKMRACQTIGDRLPF